MRFIPWDARRMVPWSMQREFGRLGGAVERASQAAYGLRYTKIMSLGGERPAAPTAPRRT